MSVSRSPTREVMTRLQPAVAPTQPGTLTRRDRAARCRLTNASTQASTDVVFDSGPGSVADISLNADRSFFASCTSGVSIHDMWARADGDAVMGDLEPQRVGEVLGARLGRVVGGQPGAGP